MITVPAPFNNWLSERSCISCVLSPLCNSFTYKEIAIIQLFLRKAKEGRHFFPLTEFHEEFINYYYYDRDGYSTFYNVINDLVTRKAILIKVDADKIQDFKISNPHDVKLNKKDILFLLNPAYSLRYEDFFSVNSTCPIGLNPLCYRILDVLTDSNGLTSHQIHQILNTVPTHEYSLFEEQKSKTIHIQTIRKRLNELGAINLIIIHHTQPTLYYPNYAHYLVNKRT
ncbi:MAG: hypothetical protein ACFFFG_11770 [Candidatus Thorarchaeota archaeon]